MAKKEKKQQAAPVDDASIIKALDELESTVVEKGDIFGAGHDPEGGLPKQGTPLSGQISRKPAPISATAAKAMSESDEDDDSDDSSSDDGSGGDDGGDDDDGAEKSLRDHASRDSIIRKAIDASDFLDSFVTVLSDRWDAVTKGLVQAVGQDRAKQSDFNRRLAMAVVGIEEQLREQLGVIRREVGELRGEMRKALDVPVYPGEGRRSSIADDEVVQPSRGPLRFTDHPLDGVDREQIGNWLMQKAQSLTDVRERETLDKNIFLWEAARYDPRHLPNSLVKAMCNEFGIAAE